MAAKLTKTEQYILDRIAQSPRGRWGFTRGFRTGSRSGLKGWGHRLSSAACKLRDRGLVTLTVLGGQRDCRSEYTDHWTEITVERAAPAD